LSASFTSFASTLSFGACSICRRLRSSDLRFLSSVHLGDDVGDARAERVDELFVSGIRVLDGVVQQRRAQNLDVLDATFVDQHVGEGDRMVDVGRRLRILALLMAVLVRREGERLKQQRQVAFHDR
jgi:hypothetical protein